MPDLDVLLQPLVDHPAAPPPPVGNVKVRARSIRRRRRASSGAVGVLLLVGAVVGVVSVVPGTSGPESIDATNPGSNGDHITSPQQKTVEVRACERAHGADPNGGARSIPPLVATRCIESVNASMSAATKRVELAANVAYFQSWAKCLAAAGSPVRLTSRVTEEGYGFAYLPGHGLGPSNATDEHCASDGTTAANRVWLFHGVVPPGANTTIAFDLMCDRVGVFGTKPIESTPTAALDAYLAANTPDPSLLGPALPPMSDWVETTADPCGVHFGSVVDTQTLTATRTRGGWEISGP